MMSINTTTTPVAQGVWTVAEHDKFLDGLKVYPRGPWKALAEFIGTRSARQVQTHAQKYQQKIARRERGLRKIRRQVARAEHRIEFDSAASCASSGEEEESPRSPELLVTWEIPPLDLNDCGATMEDLALDLSSVCTASEDDDVALELDEHELRECSEMLDWIMQAPEPADDEATQSQAAAMEDFAIDPELEQLLSEGDALLAELLNSCGR